MATIEGKLTVQSRFIGIAMLGLAALWGRSGVAQRVVTKSDSGVTLDSGIVVVLARGPCFGHCSTYKVTIDNAGHVTVEYHDPILRFPGDTIKAGTVERLFIGPQAVHDLIVHISFAQFFSLPARIDPSDPLCPAVTDMSMDTVTVVRRGVTHRIIYYEGCFIIWMTRTIGLIDAAAHTLPIKQPDSTAKTLGDPTGLTRSQVTRPLRPREYISRAAVRFRCGLYLRV